MGMQAHFPSSGARKVTLVTIRTPYGLNRLLIPFSEVHVVYSRVDACPRCTGNFGEEAQVDLWVLNSFIVQNFLEYHTNS